MHISIRRAVAMFCIVTILFSATVLPALAARTEGQTENTETTDAKRVMGRVREQNKNSIAASSSSDGITTKEYEGRRAQAALEQRLAGIEDRAKRRIAEKLSNQFDRINQAWTNHFAKLLDRYDAILAKIQTREETDATDGKDTEAVKIAISSARSAIEDARASVTAQASHLYVDDISSFVSAVADSASVKGNGTLNQLKESFLSIRETLFADLKGMRDGAMTDVRNAIQSAIRALNAAENTVDDVTQTD